MIWLMPLISISHVRARNPEVRRCTAFMVLTVVVSTPSEMILAANCAGIAGGVGKPAAPLSVLD